MQHIVIPYRHSPEGELRYTLRSIEKYCNFDYDVTIIGEKPEWCKNVIFFAYDDNAHKRYENLFNKLNIAMEHYDSFIWWHDDEYVLKPVTLEDLKQVYYLQELKKVKNFGERWFQQQLRIFKEEMDKIGLPAYNYCTHTPFYFEKDKLKEVFEYFGIDKKKELTFVENYYFNYFKLQDKALQIYPYKIGRYDATEFNTEEAKDKIFANFDEAGIASGIFDWIKETFPVPSKFEK